MRIMELENIYAILILILHVLSPILSHQMKLSLCVHFYRPYYLIAIAA